MSDLTMDDASLAEFMKDEEKVKALKEQIDLCLASPSDYARVNPFFALERPSEGLRDN